MKVPFIDLKRNIKELSGMYESIFKGVLQSGNFIGVQSNPYIKDLEKYLSDYLDNKVDVCVCNSGTTALLVALMVLNIKAGDEVIVPDFNFVAAAECVKLLGAKPVFADISYETFMVTKKSVYEKITKKTKCIIVTDMFGHFIDYNMFDDLNKDRKNKIYVIEDAAQSFGARCPIKGEAGTFGDIATTSFYPVKPLGAFGEGGAIFSKNKDYIDKAKMIINHGSNGKYNHEVLGLNGRMDAIQAAILIWVLNYLFEDNLKRRKEIAEYYKCNILDNRNLMCPESEVYYPSWAQYTILVSGRGKFREYLKIRGVDTVVHYPNINSQLPPFKTSDNIINFNADFVTTVCCSLPLNPYMTDDEVKYVVEVVNSYIKEELSEPV